MDIKQKAELVATIAHEAIDQRRKYTGEPYINHPIAVARMIESLKDSTPEMVAAAYLHDVVEDTHVSLLTLSTIFPMKVVEYVNGMTKQSDGKNRAEKKAKECVRLGKESTAVKTIKLADIIHNTSSIVKHDPDFAKVYLSENRKLIEHLRVKDDPSNERLYHVAYKTLES